MRWYWWLAVVYAGLIMVVDLAIIFAVSAAGLIVLTLIGAGIGAISDERWERMMEDEYGHGMGGKK